MKRLTVLFVFLLTVLNFYTVLAQEMGSLKKSIEISFPEKIQKLILDPLPAGTYSVGAGGYFPTLDSAFNKLSIDGIEGEVALELIDSLYIAPTGQFGFLLNGPIPGAGPSSRVIIQRALNLLPCIIQGDGQAVICLLNTSYVTIRSWDWMGRVPITVHAIKNPVYSWNDAIEFVDNSDYNIVQNIVAYTEDTEWGAAISLGVSSTDSNLIHYNVLTQGAYGIYLSGYNGSVKPKDNILRANVVGSDTDSLFWGIQSEYCQNTIIEDNLVENIKRHSLGSLIAAGINAGADNNCIIRNNVVYNIQSDEIRGSTGILLSGDVGLTGNGSQIYNNMIFEIQSTSINPESRVTGIQMWHQNNPRIYYNSVYISGSGTNQKGSAALYISHNCTNVELKNNIFVNTRDESPYCASSILDYSSTNITTNYNDLYYDDSNANNCLVNAGGTDYLTLADWQVTGQDSNSITEMPNFISPYLRIDTTISTMLNAHAIPIAGITTDFDYEPRNSITPDIGADEFNIVTGFEDELYMPTEYALEQNYPNPFNPSTTFRYSIPTQSKVVIKVFDILGNEIALLINEEKSGGTYELTWFAVGLSSGIYFYQLKAGDFVQTKKMLLLK